MKTIDSIFAWLLVALGLLHVVFALRGHLSLSYGTVWSFAAGFALIEAGFLNAIRATVRGKGLTRFASVVANICVVFIAVVVAYLSGLHLRANPQVPALLVVSIIELIFSFRGGR